MIIKRSREKRENRFGKKTQVVLLTLIFISVSISLAGITAYVTSGNTVSFQSGPTGPDLAVTSVSATSKCVNQYSDTHVTVANLGKNITSYYSIGVDFGDGTSSSITCSSSKCFWMSGESKILRVPHAYLQTGSFNISVNTYVSGDTNSANNKKSVIISVVTSIQVPINSTPSGGSAYFDNTFVGITPTSVQTTCGNHLVRIEKDGYYPYQSTITLSPGSSINAYLYPIPGNISVDSSPQGANIYIDNNYNSVGTTPRNVNVSAGTHTLRLDKIGYQNYTTSVNVLSGQTINVFAILELVPTTTTTTTMPPCQNVGGSCTDTGLCPGRYVNGSCTQYGGGITIVCCNLTSTSTTITTTLPPNQTNQTTTTITANTCSDSDGDNPNVTGTVSGYQGGIYQNRTDDCISSSTTREWICLNNNFYDKAYTCSNGCTNGRCNQTNTGSIYVTARNMSGATIPTASVYIDGILKGTTPTTVSNLAVGFHGVTVQKPGYNHNVTWAYVNADQTTIINAVLPPTPCDYNNACNIYTGEACANCPDCCIGYCGDNICDTWSLLGTGENHVSCPADCP